eukprot:TRINITY_DN1223_c0_g4_i1.p1 TRINITY_DN1223_c0_g4~~TRINITY_DN1223_c0_g4_i1.p1  ORF type:complete len:844 (-),score=129.92 TRINITY_DN1223_c0_g4_i1:106-2298(-)
MAPGMTSSIVVGVAPSMQQNVQVASMVEAAQLQPQAQMGCAIAPPGVIAPAVVVGSGMGPNASLGPFVAVPNATTPGWSGAPNMQHSTPISQAMPIPGLSPQVQPLQATQVSAQLHSHGEPGPAMSKAPHVVVPKPKAVVVPAAPMSKAQAPAPPEMLIQKAPPSDGPKQQDDGGKDGRRVPYRRNSRTRSRSRSGRRRSRSWGRRSSSGFDAKEQDEQQPRVASTPPGTDLAQYSTGEDVDIRYNQSWYVGKVVRIGMNGSVLVDVDGTQYSVDAKDVRRKTPVQAVPPPQQRQHLPGQGQMQEASWKGKGKEDSSKGKGKGKGKGKSKTCTGKPASAGTASSFCIGAPVEVRYRGNWNEGKVVKLISPEQVSVNVDGSDYEMDITEVRHVTRGGGLWVGKDVEAKYGGKWFDTQISAFTDGGKVKVRYEGSDYILSSDDIRERSAVRQSEDVKISPPRKLQRTSDWSDNPVESPEDVLADLESSNMCAQVTDGESTPSETYMELTAKAFPPMRQQIHSDESKGNDETPAATLNGGVVSQVFRSKAPSAQMARGALPPPRPRPSAPAEGAHSADDNELQVELQGQLRAPGQLPMPRPMQQSMLPAARGKSGWMPRPKQAPQLSQFQGESTDQQLSPQPRHQIPSQQAQPSPQPSQQSWPSSQSLRSMPGVRPKFRSSTNGEVDNNAPSWMPKAKLPAPLPRPSSIARGGSASLSGPPLPQPKPGPGAVA